MSTLDFPLERRLRCQKTHKKMCSVALGSELYELIHQHTCRAAARRLFCLAETPSQHLTDDVGSRTNEGSVKLLHALWTLAAPVYSIGQSDGSETRFGRIAAHETYKNWIASQKPSILHVHGISGTADASEFIFHHLNSYREAQQKKEILIYFTFKRYDDRCNSMVAMLTTLLIQMLSDCQDIYNAVRLPFEEMVQHSSWTQTDLLLLFRNMLSSWDHDGVWCVINGLTECEGTCTPFLSDIFTLAKHTERRFKIVVTSTSDGSSKRLLAEWPAINLDSLQEGVKSNPATEIDLGVLELVHKRSKFSEFEKRITRKLLDCGQDTRWRHLILNQLRFSDAPSTKLAIEQQLEILPPTTPKEIFVSILSRIPAEKIQWARKTLLWTLYTFHPLSVWELGAALMYSGENLSNGVGDIGIVAYEDIIAELNKVFQGLFIVEHNEVQFSHPDALQFFLNLDRGQESVWYNVNKETAHQEITNACFFFLSIFQGQRSVLPSYAYAPADLPEISTYTPEYGICSYAIKHWLNHYKEIRGKFHLTESAAVFCRNTKAMQLWAQAYFSLCNPISRTDGVFSSILSILAGLGLQNLWTLLPDLKPQPDRTNDCAVALAEAARHAKRDAVRTLLHVSEYSQIHLGDALIAAASSCDEDVLNTLVKKISKELRDKFKWPPDLLCRAAQFGLSNIVRKLLKFGASLEDAVSLQNSTPLHLAARHGHADVVEVLLEKGASLTALDEDGRTPLHVASKYSQTTVLSLLLAARADCKTPDRFNATALDIACENGNHEVVQLLLMNPDCVTDSDGPGTSSPLSPLLVAINKGFFSCAKYLLDKNAQTEVEDNEGRTPLYNAALNEHSELCKLLLKHGAKPNVLYKGDPILFKVATLGKLGIAKLLIDNGAEIDATNSEGRTALQGASDIGHKAVVAYLLEIGADIHHGSDNGSTPLHLAATHGFAEIVELLINSGADLQRPSPGGWTPLHLCYDYPETTRLLLKNGADVNSVTTSGFTPLYLAASNNYPEVVKVLLLYGPDIEITVTEDVEMSNFSALMTAVINGNAEVTRLLLEAGANIDHQDNFNTTALHYAVAENHCEVLRILMEYNPKIDLVDKDGDTALNCIYSKTSIEIAKILVNGGADCNIRNKNQNTPICTAVSNNNTDVLEYLTKKVELDIVGGIRGGPLHIACYLSKLHLVKILVSAGANVDLVDPVVGTPLQSACRCTRWSREEEQEDIILYLIDDAHVDLGATGGLYGCSFNAACGRSSFEIVKKMLQKGASIEVKDEMGRMAIHFAAARSKENFQVVLESGADVEATDKMGRTALHWASIGGMVQVMDRIISMSRALVDQGDLNGWTPLLWAARGSSTQQRTVSTSEQEEVIKLLLKNGANPCVTTKGLDQDWSPVKVARYHGVHTRIICLLEEKAKEKLKDAKGGDLWDEKYHESRTAAPRESNSCDCCFSVGTLSSIYRSS